MTLAHIGGVPVEELAQPLLIAVMLAGAWCTTRARGLWARARRRP